MLGLVRGCTTGSVGPRKRGGLEYKAVMANVDVEVKVVGLRGGI